MSRQFIRKNIDLISSKVQRRPTTNGSSLDQDTLTPNHLKNDDDLSELDSTIIRNGLSPKIFQNYHYNTKSSKDLNGDDLSVGYQSAYDTIPRDSILSKKSEYELKTAQDDSVQPILQEPITFHSYSSLNTEQPEIEVVSLNYTTSNCVTYSLFTFWKLLKARLENRNRIPEDLENQPLLPPNDETDEVLDNDARYISCIDNYVLLIIVSVILGSILITTIIINKDTELLIKVLKGLLCYFIGANLSSKLFGQEFCPTF